MYNPYRPAQRRPLWPLLLVAVIVVIVAIVLLLLFLDSGGYFGIPRRAAPGGSFITDSSRSFSSCCWSSSWSGWYSGRGCGEPGQGYSRPYRGQFRDPAVMTARQRYARGEISREQYDQLMTELTRRRTGP